MKLKKQVTVCGVNLNKVDGKSLSDALKKALNKKISIKSIADGGSYEVLTSTVRELSEHFKSVTKDQDIMACDLCGGGSTADFDECPFCAGKAEADITEGGAMVISSTEADISTPLRTVLDSPEDDDTVITNPQRIIHGFTEQTLNEEMLRISAAQEAGSTALWIVSVTLRKIYDGDLWKLRNDEDGKPKYKSFSKFLAEEVPLHERTVWRMIEVAKQLKESQLKKYGQTILRGLLAAPKEDRDELLEKIDLNEIKGSRALQKEVQTLRKKKGISILEGAGRGDSTGAKQATLASAALSEKRKLITVPFPAGRKTIHLFSYSSDKKAEPKRAKKVSDRPWGKFETSTGVTLYVALVENASNQLDITIEARREE